MSRKQLIQITILSIAFLVAYLGYKNIASGQDIAITDVDTGQVTVKDNYFKDKTIQWVIPFKEGGGGDTWARFNAPFLLSTYLAIRSSL